MPLNIRTVALLGATLSLALATPAQAGSRDGAIQVRGFATAVLPDGGIERVTRDAIGLPAGAQSRATDSVIPTVAVEYFFNSSLSVETICCVTPHDVRGAGALDGAELVDDAIILPATVTAKLHLDLGAVKPYIGAGPAMFLIFGEDVGADAAALGATSVDLSDEIGLALQAGFDVPLGDGGLGLSVDAKRYFVDTTATFRAGTATALQTEHVLDPWVVSAGIAYRF